MGDHIEHFGSTLDVELAEYFLQVELDGDDSAMRSWQPNWQSILARVPVVRH